MATRGQKVRIIALIISGVCFLGIILLPGLWESMPSSLVFVLGLVGLASLGVSVMVGMFIDDEGYPR